jgi:hypothetical protein
LVSSGFSLSVWFRGFGFDLFILEQGFFKPIKFNKQEEFSSLLRVIEDPVQMVRWVRTPDKGSKPEPYSWFGLPTMRVGFWF